MRLHGTAFWGRGHRHRRAWVRAQSCNLYHRIGPSWYKSDIVFGVSRLHQARGMLMEPVVQRAIHNLFQWAHQAVQFWVQKKVTILTPSVDNVFQIARHKLCQLGQKSGPVFRTEKRSNFWDRKMKPIASKSHQKLTHLI